MLVRQLQSRLYTTTLTQVRQQSRAASNALEKLALPTVPTCPSPTCFCAAMPEGLDIRHDTPMTLPPHARHVVIFTRRSDWASRIEDEEASVLGDVEEGKPRANLAKALKSLVGPGGKYYNVCSTSRA